MSWVEKLNNMNPVAQDVALGDRILTASVQTPGNAYFVDSTNGVDDPDFNGTSWTEAKATIDEAVNLCTADNGDIIYVAPFHAEDLAADSAVDIDVAGVTIIGIKIGRQMPTLTATVIAGDLKLAAANTTIANLRFLGGVDATTGCIEVSAADCTVVGCEYRDSTDQATDILITTAAADRLLIDDFRVIGASVGGSASAIALVGADDTVIRNCKIYGNFSVGAIDFRTTLSARVKIHDCDIWTENAADVAIVDTITSSTGQIGPRINIVLQDDADNIQTAVTGATFHIVGDVQVVNAVNEKSIPITWTESAEV